MFPPSESTRCGWSRSPQACTSSRSCSLHVVDNALQRIAEACVNGAQPGILLVGASARQDALGVRVALVEDQVVSRSTEALEGLHSGLQHLLVGPEGFAPGA